MNCEWYTPDAVISLVYGVLGGIDLDPASSALANETIRAKQFFTAENNGLVQVWEGRRIFLNPPYSFPAISQFTDRLIGETRRRPDLEAVVLVNSKTETGWWQRLYLNCNAYCFPSSRLRFWSPDSHSNQPRQPSTLFYFGLEVARFRDAFCRLGVVGAGKMTT